ncbi:MAG: hypothetical protein Q8N18_16220 [Opitutaceae bacterium]|nr:hypothetical protein [Opitutaceae bacterium]
MHRIVGLVVCSVIVLAARAQEAPVDFEKARRIFERARNGETLSSEDRAYVERAKQAKQKQPAAKNSPSAPPKWTQPLTPLTELGAATYKGEAGGLYGGGRNTPPEAHLAAALRESAQIRPLDAAGRAAAEGKIGLLAVGMSNTTQEFSRFMQEAARDPQKSPRVVLVDGAQGGQTGARWADPAAPLWAQLDERIARAGLSAAQIQAVWMKQAESGPARLGDFPKHTDVLRENLVVVLGHLKQRFPNLRLVYLSSRIYAGYATTALNPEPYAYESAFAVRRLIQDQITGRAELNFDATRGAVRSPLLLWGPYLWADGATPRAADRLTYEPGDFAADGTHPGETGRAKVARLLLDFFKTDPTAKPWFLTAAASPPRP